jgi:hypothetical protein
MSPLRERQAHAIDWRPATIACVLYAVSVAAIAFGVILPGAVQAVS